MTTATTCGTVLERDLAYYSRGPRETLAWKQGIRPGLQRHPRWAGFLDWSRGDYAGEKGWQAHRFAPREALAAILETLALQEHWPDTLYLTGPNLATERPERAWYEAAVASGWALFEWRSNEHSCYLARGDRRVQLRLAAEWFGEERDPRHCRDAWKALRRRLAGSFGEYSYLYPNPTQTGLYLAEMKLPEGRTYPVLPDGLRELLVHNNTQGRTEVVTPPGMRELPRLFNLDGRWMYASCVRNLPTGAWTFDHRDEWAGYTPGFYLVTARVPEDWTHIGLLPCLDAAGETYYPHTRGQWFTTWASSAEVALAREHGWIRRIQKRLLWPETGQGDPLRGWAQRLRGLRAAAEENAEQGDPIAVLLARAYRTLLIRPIGSFHSTHRRTEGVAPFSEAASVPAGATYSVRSDGVHWTLGVERVNVTSHPEWSATVWGRTRAKLAAAALQLPRQSLVALRTDAIWTTRDPGWQDTGQPGAFRIKRRMAGPLPAPHTTAEFLALVSGRGASLEEDE